MKRPRGHKMRRIFSNIHKAKIKRRLVEDKIIKPPRRIKIP